MKHSFLLLLIGLLCWTGSHAATRTYAYDGSKTQAENGTALQAAIDAASSGDELKVQAGTYIGNFTMKEGVQVSGGWNADFTAQTDYATILDAIESGRVVNQAAAFSTLTVWSNLTIQNGSDTNESTGGGGAWLNRLGQLKHCLIQNNQTTGYGGGVGHNVTAYANHGEVVITDCIVRNNKSSKQGGGVRIGATIEKSLLERNQSGADGAGVYLQHGRMVNCIVRLNRSTGNAGGVRAYGQCDIYNSAIYANLAEGQIGGLSEGNGDNNNVNIINNTIICNRQKSSTNKQRCGVLYGGNASGNAKFINNVIWGNKYGDDVYETQSDGLSTSKLTGANALTNNAVYNAAIGTNGINLSASDPGFEDVSNADTTKWNLEITYESSLCNQGYNTDASGSTDLAGLPRIVDGTVDIGAYECQWVEGDRTVKVGENLQNVIDHTFSGNTVMVQAGTFYGNFTMKDGVNVSGGWNEDFTSQTDYVTILDAQESGRVVNQPSAFSTLTIWSNLTIQNGSLSSKQSDEGGAGVWLNKKGQVKHCKIQNNTYTYESGNCLGGGVGNNAVDAATDVLIDECIICNNRASHGGGVRIRGTIQNSEVYGNTATNNSGGAFILGGGYAVNTIIHDNTGKGIGGIKLQGAGEIRECQIYDNNSTTDATGGVNLHERAAMYNCVIRGNKSNSNIGGVRLTTDNNGNGCTLANCLIVDNEATGTVSGLSLEATGSPSTLHKVYNNTIVGNSQASSSNPDYCGVRLNVGGPLQFCNNVVWGNKANGAVQASQIHVLASYSKQANNFVNNALVWSGKLSDGNDFVVPSTISLTEDPFKDAANGDYTPTAGSGLIDSGNGGYFHGTTDLAGNTRKQGTIDRGCYEQAAYSREVTEGRFGTICLPYDVPADAIVGAKVYKVISFASDAKAGLLLEQVNAMTAGKPYFFSSEADKVVFAYLATGDAATAGSENGLYGTLAGETISGADYYVLQNNLLCPATAGEITLAANRAYLMFSEVPDYEGAAPSPIRRVITIQQTENTATGAGQMVNDKSVNGKFIHDGQLLIIRDGKTYNVLGL